SRRRHTRSKRDWSSDVCSSDLIDQLLRRYLRCAWVGPGDLVEGRLDRAGFNVQLRFQHFQLLGICGVEDFAIRKIDFFRHQSVRSEERRVGKECRSRWV